MTTPVALVRELYSTLFLCYREEDVPSGQPTDIPVVSIKHTLHKPIPRALLQIDGVRVANPEILGREDIDEIDLRAKLELAKLQVHLEHFSRTAPDTILPEGLRYALSIECIPVAQLE